MEGDHVVLLTTVRIQSEGAHSARRGLFEETDVPVVVDKDGEWEAGIDLPTAYAPESDALPS